MNPFGGPGLRKKTSLLTMKSWGARSLDILFQKGVFKNYTKMIFSEKREYISNVLLEMMYCKVLIVIVLWVSIAMVLRIMRKANKLKAFRGLLDSGGACDFYRDKIRITGRVRKRNLDEVWVEYTMFPLTGEKDTTVVKLKINQILRPWGQ